MFGHSGFHGRHDRRERRGGRGEGGGHRMGRRNAAWSMPRPARPPVRHYSTGQVVRGIWRGLVVVKDALALIFLLAFFALLAALLTVRPNSAAIIPGGALVLRLDGTISEQPAPVVVWIVLRRDGPRSDFGI